MTLVCTHPLDSLLAFLGAITFLGILVIVPISAAFEWSENDIKKIYHPERKAEYPITLFLLCIIGSIAAVVILLLFVNMALPQVCR